MRHQRPAPTTYLIRRTHAVTIDVVRFGRPTPVRVLSFITYDDTGSTANIVRARSVRGGRPVRLSVREEDRAIFRSLAALV